MIENYTIGKLEFFEGLHRSGISDEDKDETGLEKLGRLWNGYPVNKLAQRDNDGVKELVMRIGGVWYKVALSEV